MSTALAVRITTWQWARANLAALLGREPEHVGATAGWAEELKALPAANLAPDPAPEVLTGECLRTVTDELGRWVPELYDLEPARLFDAVLLGSDAGAPFRNGGVA